MEINITKSWYCDIETLKGDISQLEKELEESNNHISELEEIIEEAKTIAPEAFI